MTLFTFVHNSKNQLPLWLVLLTLFLILLTWAWSLSNCLSVPTADIRQACPISAHALQQVCQSQLLQPPVPLQPTYQMR